MRESLDWKIALRTGLGAALTWIIDQQLTEMVGWTDRSISGLWAVISSIVVLQSTLGGGYLEGYKRFIGILLGSLMGGLAATFLGWQAIHLAIALFLTVLLMGTLKLQISTRIACLSCAVVIVVWSLNPVGSPWEFALHRFLDSCLGLFVGLLTSHFLFPSETRKKLKDNRESIFALFSESLSTKEVKPLEKAQSLLKEDDQLIKEMQAEWTLRAETLEKWETFHHSEKALLALLTTTSHLPQKALFSLLDAPLLQATTGAIKCLEKAFEGLGKGSEEKSPLLEWKNRLKEERLRYRETRATRNFPFDELENYFVFFYSLEELLLETHLLQEAL